METTEFYKHLREKAGVPIKTTVWKPLLPCCGSPIESGHYDTCVNFQPDGDVHTNRFVPHGGHGYDPTKDDCFGFDTSEELLKHFEDWTKMEKFHRFSLSLSKHSPRVSLMAEFDDGYKWWCLGYLRNKLNDLPEWKEKYK